MSGWISFAILVLIIMCFAWVGNKISDTISDSVRNKSIRDTKLRNEATGNETPAELLSERFKGIN